MKFSAACFRVEGGETERQMAAVLPGNGGVRKEGTGGVMKDRNPGGRRKGIKARIRARIPKNLDFHRGPYRVGVSRYDHPYV